MPTQKNRLNLSLPADMETLLKAYAELDGVPVATKAVELLKQALEWQEDRYFDKVATSRKSKDEKLLTHDEVWK
jgi:hypothetical protein